MQAARPLASTTFIAGVEDDLATPDVYTIQSDAVINDLPIPSSIANVDDIANELRGGSSMVNTLPSLTSLGNVASSLTGSTTNSAVSSLVNTASQIGSTILKAVGGVSGVKALASGNGSSLLSRLNSGTLTGIPGLNAANVGSLSSLLNNSNMPASVKQALNVALPSVLGTYGGTGNSSYRLRTGNINNAYQVSSLINNVTGNTATANVVDKDATSRLISVLAMGGMGSDVNNSFSALLPLAGGDKTIQVSAAQSTARYASLTGNIGGMKDVTTAIGGSNLISIGKSLLKTFSSNYQPSSTQPMSTQARQADFTNITSTFSSINPNWLHEDRYTVDPSTQQPVLDFPVLDASMVREGSSDFAATMQCGAMTTTDPDLKYLAMATNFPTSTPEQELRKSFPYTYTNINTNTTATNTFTPAPMDVMDTFPVT